MKTFYIAGNWKMHKTLREAVEYASTLKTSLSNCTNTLMIAPPYTALAAVYEAIKGSNIRLGAQNMGQEETGAHTGEVSPLMLKDVGVSTVILGHSERRHTYLETNELVNKKVLLALKHGFEVILCIGETLEERESGNLEKILQEQLIGGLKSVAAEVMKSVVIAYEPVWAIGTGKTATPEDAETVHKFIRNVLKTMYSDSISKNTIIQYGGSVKPDNIKALMSMPNIDGALVGGASLKEDQFVPIATVSV
jgi:triosephosphate isomerase